MIQNSAEPSSQWLEMTQGGWDLLLITFCACTHCHSSTPAPSLTPLVWVWWQACTIVCPYPCPCPCLFIHACAHCHSFTPMPTVVDSAHPAPALAHICSTLFVPTQLCACLGLLVLHAWPHCLVVLVWLPLVLSHAFLPSFVLVYSHLYSFSFCLHLLVPVSNIWLIHI